MTRVAVAALLVAGAVFAPSAAGAGVGLVVSPLRLALAGGSSATITVRNPTVRPLVVRVGRAGFARSLRGRPRVLAAHRGAAPWLRLRPRRLRLAPGGVATLHVRVRPPAAAGPGDHPALILLTTQPPGTQRVRILLRVGVEVLVRVPGPTVRRLEPRGLTVRRRGTTRLLELRLVNGGNLTQRLDRRSAPLVLVRDGDPVAKLRPRNLELLPHSAGIAEFVYRGRIRGVLVARILRHAFRLRL
ncbi:MAG TPA: hypothetical protein VKR79_00480 [Gaiellaceae bacterium]|nr:hypothetical protein [Gaiellaceae bacterium]